MSDSGNSFGEALESMTTNTKKAIGGTIADFKNSVKGQVAGGSGISGSFTPGQKAPNPNTLSGGDLFSPDMMQNKSQNQIPLAKPDPALQDNSQTQAVDNAKSPEEAAKIQSIQQELHNMHQKYYQDFLAKAEGRDRKTQVAQQEEEQEKQQEEKMEDMQKQQKKQADDAALQRSQRATEVKGGMG